MMAPEFRETIAAMDACCWLAHVITVSSCLAPTGGVVAHPSHVMREHHSTGRARPHLTIWNSAQQQHVAMSISITGTRFLITKKKSIIQDEAGQQEQGPSVTPT